VANRNKILAVGLVEQYVVWGFPLYMLKFVNKLFVLNGKYDNSYENLCHMKDFFT
jgi:hypothetical protein